MSFASVALPTKNRSLTGSGQNFVAISSGKSVYIGGNENTVTRVNGNTVTLSSAVTLKKGDIISGIGGGKDGSAVFATLFLGENAYGVTDIEGGGLQHIVKPRGYGNDPLNQRSSIGWKATKVAKRLLEEYIVRVESGTEFSMTTENN